MIEVYPRLYLGDSDNGERSDVAAVLNVATDLHIERGWPDVQYSQVGLTDGPGNHIAAYHAAVLVVDTLMKCGKRVLVCCHDGRSRSVAVVIMYLHLIRRMGWNHWLKIINEKKVAAGLGLADPHPAHKTAFYKINWRLLVTATEE